MDQKLKLRILLADDHAVVRAGLKWLVEAEADMEIIGEATSGREAVTKARELAPDLVVMDISMPGLSGAEATAQLRQTCPHVKVLALTVHENKGYLRLLLDAGASGYVLKRAAAEDLVRAIRTVAAGGTYLDPAIAAKVVGGFLRKPSAEEPAHGQDLSERESDVLRLLAQGFSNKEVAAKLDLSVKTIETYKARSLEKLGLHSRADVVRYALNRGWLHEE